MNLGAILNTLLENALHYFILRFCNLEGFGTRFPTGLRIANGNWHAFGFCEQGSGHYSLECSAIHLGGDQGGFSKIDHSRHDIKEMFVNNLNLRNNIFYSPSLKQCYNLFKQKIYQEMKNANFPVE